MILFDAINGGPAQEARDGRIFGVVTGVVTNNQDPDGMGRVKVKFSWLSETDESAWARIAAPMAGSQRGMYLLPEVDDEVLLAFEQGDSRFPYVLGGLWGGKDAPPETNQDGENNRRLFKSRSGHVMILNDEDGKETIEIKDKSGNNSIVFDTAKNTITIASDQDIVLSASRGTIKLDAQNIELHSSAATKIEADGAMEVKSGSPMTIKGSTVNIN